MTSPVVSPPVPAESVPAPVGPMDSVERVGWVAHPAREGRARAVAAVVVIAALAICTALLAGHLLWTPLAFAALVLAQSRFFFPTHYALDETGIEARHLGRVRRLAWSSVREFVHDERGGCLLSGSRRALSRRRNDLPILFGPQGSAPIVATIELAVAEGRAR